MDQTNKEQNQSQYSDGQQNAMPEQDISQNTMPKYGVQQDIMPQYGMPQNTMPQNTMPQYGMQQDIMPQYGMPQNTMPQYGMPQSYDNMGGLTPKSIVSRVGIALAMMAAVVIGVQFLIEILVSWLKPELAETDWYGWALTAISMVATGFPVYLLFIRRAPDSPKKEVVKLKPLSFIAIFFICTAAMYISSFVGSFITMGIAFLKGEALSNPVAEVIINSNYVITLIYAVIVAPILEELIFRKFLLDKLRRFGDIPAILMTGLAFGLFHMNLSQFFYAAVLGFIFAYVTIRTNTIRYSILLHMMINSIGTIITPFISENNILFILLLMFWILAAITVGVVLFIVNFKKIKLERVYPLMRVRDYFLNAGSILYTVICLVVIVIVTIA